MNLLTNEVFFIDESAGDEGTVPFLTVSKL